MLLRCTCRRQLWREWGRANAGRHGVGTTRLGSRTGVALATHCSRIRHSSTASAAPSPSSSTSQSAPGAERGSPAFLRSSTPAFDQEIAQLATLPLQPLTLTDLVRFGRPPLPAAHLLSSAAFTLRVLPIRLARRVLSLRNLPYIVVSNPHISSIYNNYLHSLRLLLSFPQSDFPSNLQEEARFNDVLAEVVDTHSNTIPTLARGFIECRRYVSAEETTSFLDEHLRARIGTRLLAEQHLALHQASESTISPQTAEQREEKPKARAVVTPAPMTNSGRPDVERWDSTYIGTIDTRLNPSKIVASAAEFVGDICDLRYGVRPKVEIDGMKDATFAYVPVHLEYIMTELLKNAFRATVENGTADIPIRVTIAAAEMIDDPTDEIDDVDGYNGGSTTGRSGKGSDRNSSASYAGQGTNGRWGDERMHVVKPETKRQGDGGRWFANNPFGSGFGGGFGTSSAGPSGNGSNGGASYSPPASIRSRSEGDGSDSEGVQQSEEARAITIRIRDRGGGISPEHLPNIFSYSFTTFNPQSSFSGSGSANTSFSAYTDSGAAGMDVISSTLGDLENSTIAGLGFGMGLSRSYAQFFGGDLKVESLYGWGTDVYVGLRGLSVDMES